MGYNKNTMTLNIKISPQTKQKLSRLALQYGLSLREFSARILEELNSELPEDRFTYYRNPKTLRASFNRGLADFRAGRVSAKL